MSRWHDNPWEREPNNEWAFKIAIWYHGRLIKNETPLEFSDFINAHNGRQSAMMPLTAQQVYRDYRATEESRIKAMKTLREAEGRAARRGVGSTFLMRYIRSVGNQYSDIAILDMYARYEEEGWYHEIGDGARELALETPNTGRRTAMFREATRMAQDMATRQMQILTELPPI